MRATLVLFIALAMVGCREQTDDNLEVTNVTPAADVGSTPTTGVRDPVVEADRIPAKLRGRWGMTATDCTSQLGDAKGLLRITDTQLQFYESKGILTKVTEQSSTHILADFAFTGEGMNWTRRMSLERQDDGTTLIRREWGEGAAPDPFRYTRCRG